MKNTHNKNNNNIHFLFGDRRGLVATGQSGTVEIRSLGVRHRIGIQQQRRGTFIHCDRRLCQRCIGRWNVSTVRGDHFAAAVHRVTAPAAQFAQSVAPFGANVQRRR